jgi:hypothetical protein
MQDLPQDPATPDEGTPVTPPGDGVHQHDHEDRSFISGQDAEPDVAINPVETDPVDIDHDNPDEFAPDVPPNLPPGSTQADPSDTKSLHGES